MKDVFFDYLTSQEQKKFNNATERGMELSKEIEKLSRARVKNTKTVVDLLEIAEQRMKDVGNPADLA